MTEIKQDEIQQEFFGEFGAPASKPKSRFPSLQKAQKPILINTSIEQILLVAILLILAACLVFFLGILRGRSLSALSPQSAPVLRSVAAVSVPERKSGAGLSVQADAPMSKKIAQAQIATREANRVGAQTAPAANLGKPYTIQLVTFKKEDLAEKEVAKLRAKGIYAFIIPSGDYYQVCAGQYVSKEDAGRNIKNFSGKYRDCFIRRR